MLAASYAYYLGYFVNKKVFNKNKPAFFLHDSFYLDALLFENSKGLTPFNLGQCTLENIDQDKVA